MNVYDFDGTIYDGDSTLDFYFYCLKKRPGLVRFLGKQGLGWMKYRLGKQDKTALKQVFYCFLQGIPEPQKMVQDFWDENQGKVKGWYLGQRREDDVVISASPDYLLGEICRRLGISRLICSRVDGKTGVYQGKNCYGEEKVRRFYEEMGGDTRIQGFYSDSDADTPLALLAKESYLVKGECLLPWPKQGKEGLDIFDRGMKLPGFRIFFPFYRAHKEGLLYLFFGGLTFLISVLSYMLFYESLGMHELLANGVSWILAVLFAFFTNRAWVFGGRERTAGSLISQVARFFAARVFTLLVEEAILYGLITRLGWASTPVKILAQIVVIVLNYGVSKCWVFGQKKK